MQLTYRSIASFIAERSTLLFQIYPDWRDCKNDGHCSRKPDSAVLYVGNNNTQMESHIQAQFYIRKHKIVCGYVCMCVCVCKRAGIMIACIGYPGQRHVVPVYKLDQITNTADLFGQDIAATPYFLISYTHQDSVRC